MKLFLIIIVFYNVATSQLYELSILGYHTTDVIQDINYDLGVIEYNVQNRGLLDFVWPTKNYYATNFDSIDYTLLSWHKKINQGVFEDSLYCKAMHNNQINYNNKINIIIEQPIQNIFTLLAMVQKEKYDVLDTKWFHYEHEGRLGKARFIWADSSLVSDGSDSVLCDHYRLDLVINDTTQSLGTIKDYFLKYIIYNTFVRELWVSRTEKREIIKAKVKTPWLSVIAKRSISN